jgi:N-acetylglucosaminyldiphosphoundecaprenol N-acetyl-beta-D-mannosaminyltransferase
MMSPRNSRLGSFWSSCSRRNRLVATLADVFSSPWETRPVRVQTVNLQHLHLIRESQSLADAAMAADLVSADGWPIAFLARRAGLPCDRVTGRQVVDVLLTDPAFAGRRVALLGSTEGTARSFADLLCGNQVALVYSRHGDATTWDVDAIAAEVNRRDCDVVLVALGAPRGEPIAQALAARLARGLIIGVGGAVEMVTGDMPAAPGWTGRLGLEWAYRLCREPRRLGRRYLIESPRALVALALVLARTGT